MTFIFEHLIKFQVVYLILTFKKVNVSLCEESIKIKNIRFYIFRNENSQKFSKTI